MLYANGNRRACDQASLFVGWLVDRKGRTGPREVDQPKKRGDQEESEQARRDDAAVCRTTKLQLARFGHIQICQIRAYNTLVT